MADIPKKIAVVDTTAIERLRIDIGQEATERLLESLRLEILNSHIKIQAYRAEGNMRLLENQGHALKSAARSFGALYLGEVCRQLELAARSEASEETLHLLMQSLDTCIAETLKAYSEKGLMKN
ncbi:Hpt domain-containing protein [Kordiimonas pumila]|uniref:Hpt domain-containing protein n=1 Tax=Kordiimonas pumila TaxID=2161677 RepID=A0ABV7D5Z3_9PROT|nr:Hpt domain-containing protein [Kordiimonas pumila]